MQQSTVPHVSLQSAFQHTKNPFCTLLCELLFTQGLTGDCFIAFDTDKYQEKEISNAHHIQKQRSDFVYKYNNKGFIMHVV